MIAMIMHFYPGMDYEKAMNLTLPQLESLHNEIANVYHTFNPPDLPWRIR